MDHPRYPHEYLRYTFTHPTTGELLDIMDIDVAYLRQRPGDDGFDFVEAVFNDSSRGYLPIVRIHTIPPSEGV